MNRLWLVMALCGAAIGCSEKGAPAAPDATVSDAKSLLDVALTVRGKLEPRFRAQLRADLGAAYAKTKNEAQARVELAAALEEAAAIGDAGDRDRVKARIARGYILLGDRGEARKIAETIGGADDRGEVLGELADDPSQALALPTPADRDRALARLAIQDAGRGELDRAGHLVQRIGDETLRPAVMGAITEGMLKAGRAVDASRLVAQLEGIARSEAEAAHALFATARGDAKAARKWIRAIESELVRARTLAVQATLHPVNTAPRQRLADEALRVALDVRSADLRSAALEAVARTFADNADPVGAAAVLRAGLDEPARNERGRSALDAAGARRVRALVAQSWAATGAVDQASRLAEQIDDAVLASEVWAAIARASATRGNVEPALSAASRIIHDELRLPVAADIAVASVQGDITPSMRAAMAGCIVRDQAALPR